MYSYACLFDPVYPSPKRALLLPCGHVQLQHERPASCGTFSSFAAIIIIIVQVVQSQKQTQPKSKQAGGTQTPPLPSVPPPAPSIPLFNHPISPSRGGGSSHKGRLHNRDLPRNDHDPSNSTLNHRLHLHNTACCRSRHLIQRRSQRQART